MIKTKLENQFFNDFFFFIIFILFKFSKTVRFHEDFSNKFKYSIGNNRYFIASVWPWANALSVILDVMYTNWTQKSFYPGHSFFFLFFFQPLRYLKDEPPPSTRSHTVTRISLDPSAKRTHYARSSRRYFHFNLYYCAVRSVLPRIWVHKPPFPIVSLRRSSVNERSSPAPFRAIPGPRFTRSGLSLGHVSGVLSVPFFRSHLRHEFYNRQTLCTGHVIWLVFPIRFNSFRVNGLDFLRNVQPRPCSFFFFFFNLSNVLTVCCNRTF